MEVTVTIKRDNGAGKTYQFKETGASKKGTFMTFSPAGENEDLPEFAKLYVKVDKADKATKKVKVVKAAEKPA